jgi:hypothetical protein
MTPTLAPTPAILGTSMLGLGIYRILSPRQAYTLFGLPFPQPPSDTPSPFIYNCAGRDLTLGAAYLLLGAQKNREGLRALVLATAVRLVIRIWYRWFVWQDIDNDIDCCARRCTHCVGTWRG